MNLPTLIARLTELEGKATPGKWVAESWCSDFDSNSWAAVGPKHTQRDEEDELDPSSEAAIKAEMDAQLIAEMRSALPLLLEALAIQREALEFIAAPGALQTRDDWQMKRARKALARMDALAGKLAGREDGG
jgi:hypothetical protein